MAQTAQTKNNTAPVTPEDFQALTELRNDLDAQSEGAIAANKTYIAGVLTEIVVFMDDKLTRANRFSRRAANAQKRSKVRELRKLERAGYSTSKTDAKSSQSA